MGSVVLVTGGNGFVAGWCMIDLLERGYTVRATMRDLSHGSAAARVPQNSDRVSDETVWADPQRIAGSMRTGVPRSSPNVPPGISWQSSAVRRN
jgi:nucleoside-diphosphate-sugar epimerase